MISNNVAWRRVFTDHIPSLSSRSPIRGPRTHCLNVSLGLAEILRVATVYSCASNLHGCLPDQLGEMASFFGEPCGFRVVVQLAFVAPGLNSGRCIGVSKSEVFAIWAILDTLFVSNCRESDIFIINIELDLLSASRCRPRPSHEHTSRESHSRPMRLPYGHHGIHS